MQRKKLLNWQAFGRLNIPQIKLLHRLISLASIKILNGKDSNLRRSPLNGNKTSTLVTSRRNKSMKWVNHMQRWFTNLILNTYRPKANMRWLIAMVTFQSILTLSGNRLSGHINTIKTLDLLRTGVHSTWKQRQALTRLKEISSIPSVDLSLVQGTTRHTKQFKNKQWNNISQRLSYKWSENRLKQQTWRKMNLRDKLKIVSMASLCVNQQQLYKSQHFISLKQLRHTQHLPLLTHHQLLEHHTHPQRLRLMPTQQQSQYRCSKSMII